MGGLGHTLLTKLISIGVISVWDLNEHIWNLGDTTLGKEDIFRPIANVHQMGKHAAHQTHLYINRFGLAYFWFDLNGNIGNLSDTKKKEYSNQVHESIKTSIQWWDIEVSMNF